jgi:hypothetical protein
MVLRSEFKACAFAFTVVKAEATEEFKTAPMAKLMPKTLPTATAYLEAGDPLPRATFLLVFLGELAARMLTGQEPAAWTPPLLHAGLAWLAVRTFCRVVDRLYERFCLSIPSRQFPS